MSVNICNEVRSSSSRPRSFKRLFCTFPFLHLYKAERSTAAAVNASQINLKSSLLTLTCETKVALHPGTKCKSNSLIRLEAKFPTILQKFSLDNFLYKLINCTLQFQAMIAVFDKKSFVTNLAKLHD